MTDPIYDEETAVLRQVLGESFHVALRKVTDSPYGTAAYRAIDLMPPAEWDRVLRYVVDALGGRLRAEDPPPPQRPVDDYDAALLTARWYAVPDDTIGSWAVSTVDKPLSAHGTRDIYVGDMMTEPIARAVAYEHNVLLDRRTVRDRG